MSGPSDRRAVIIGRAGSLRRVTRCLREIGWDPVRVEAIRTVPTDIGPPPRWLQRHPPPDLWIVTSRAVVDTFLRAHPSWKSGLQAIPAIVAVGDDTRHALESAGFGPVRAAPGGGSQALERSLGPLAGRRVVYLRSARASPELARRLRRRGARVLSRIVYRVVQGPPLRGRERHRISGASVWVVTSPSALEGFRRQLGPALFRERIGRVRTYALGGFTAAALRRAGARRVADASKSTEEGLTKLLAKELNDA